MFINDPLHTTKLSTPYTITLHANCMHAMIRMFVLHFLCSMHIGQKIGLNFKLCAFVQWSPRNALNINRRGLLQCTRIDWLTDEVYPLEIYIRRPCKSKRSGGLRALKTRIWEGCVVQASIYSRILTLYSHFSGTPWPLSPWVTVLQTTNCTAVWILRFQ